MKKIIMVIRWSVYIVIGVLLGEQLMKNIAEGNVTMNTGTDPRALKYLIILGVCWTGSIMEWFLGERKSRNIFLAIIGFITFFNIFNIFLQIDPTWMSNLKILNAFSLKTKIILCSIVFSFALLIICFLVLKLYRLLFVVLFSIIGVSVGSAGSERKTNTKARDTGSGLTTYTDEDGYVVGHGTEMGGGITIYTDKNGNVVGHGTDMGNGMTLYTDEDGYVVGNKIDL